MIRMPIFRLLAAIWAGLSALGATGAAAETFRVTLGSGLPQTSYDGRVILVISKEPTPEPRMLAQRGSDSAQVFGVDVNAWQSGQDAVVTPGITGYPVEDLSHLPAGQYWVQAVLHKYDTFTLANGKVVKLPAARGAGQNWRKEPGNVISEPRSIDFDPNRDGEIQVRLDEVIPPVPEPEDTEFVKYFKFRSPSLSQFWGRDIYLNGFVLVPKDFDQHPEARYPLMINHGHFPEEFGNFRTTPPDTDAPCIPSARFEEPCYNHIEQQEAYDFYRKWIADDFSPPPNCRD